MGQQLHVKSVSKATGDFTTQIALWPMGKSVRMAEHFLFIPTEQQQFQGFGSRVNKQNKAKLPSKDCLSTDPKNVYGYDFSKALAYILTM